MNAVVLYFLVTDKHWLIVGLTTQPYLYYLWCCRYQRWRPWWRRRWSRRLFSTVAYETGPRPHPGIFYQAFRGEYDYFHIHIIWIIWNGWMIVMNDIILNISDVKHIGLEYAWVWLSMIRLRLGIFMKAPLVEQATHILKDRSVCFGCFH